MRNISIIDGSWIGLKQLKTGTRVSLRNCLKKSAYGWSYIIFLNTPKGDVLYNGIKDYYLLSDYNDDLTHRNNSELDVVKMWSMPNDLDLECSFHMGDFLWEDDKFVEWEKIYWEKSHIKHT